MNPRVVFPGGRVYVCSYDAGEKVGVGFRVLCSVGNKKVAGIVVGHSEEEPEGRVLSIPDKKPIVLYTQIEAVRELAYDYLRPWGSLLFSLLPSSFLLRWEKKVYAVKGYGGYLDPASENVLSYLKERGGVRLESLKKKYPTSLIKLLMKKGFIRVQEGWSRPPVKEEAVFSLLLPLKEAISRVRSPRKRRIIVLLAGRDFVSERELKEWGVSATDLRDLVSRGIVERKHRDDRYVEPTAVESRLFPIREVGGSLTYLSGVFSEVIAGLAGVCEEAVREKKSVLCLFTTLSQLYRAYGTLYQLAGMEVVQIHSGVRPSLLLENWLKIHDKPCLILGTYISALVPLSSAHAVCVVDESSSGVRIRQAGGMDLRRLAMILGRKLSAKVVMAGPSPSVRAYSMIDRGISDHRELSDKEPSIRVIRRSAVEIFTEELVEKLRKDPTRSVLFLVPKEGYSYLYCPRCQSLCQCPLCETFLTFSRERDRFYCTKCGYVHGGPYCPDCEGEVKDSGFGIERAVEIAENILGIEDRFSFDTYPGWEERYDLVAVLSADSILSLPSYRSQEEFFLYLMRAKRVARHELIVQTMFPDLAPVKAISRPELFYRGELKRREDERLPPFWRLVKVSTTKEDLPSYLAKVVSPHVQAYRNYKRGTTEILIRIRDRRALKKLEDIKRRFSKDIIELRVDPPL